MSAPAIPASGTSQPSRMALPHATAPVAMPATAPRAVRPRHQMPSSRAGHSVEAVNANTSPTDPASPADSVTAATRSGTITESAAAMRKPRTEPANSSCDTTPASDTTRPDDVDRNAPNAPAIPRAVRAPAHGDGSTAAGRGSSSAPGAPRP